MDKSMIERYKREMMEMYGLKAFPEKIPAVAPATEETSSGGLIGIVTTIRDIYPVSRAKVTVFTGDIDNMQVRSEGYTDQSGRTQKFVLEAPERSQSQTPNENKIPYASYNMMVEAEGYRSNIHLNIPVFSGVTSLQKSNMMLLETAGEDEGPQIFDESENFDL